MIRRILAVVVCLLTLNVSAAEALRVCANQSEHAAPAQAGHAEHHEHSAPAPEPHPAAPDDSAPSALNCCEAMTSCGISIAMDVAEDTSSVDSSTEGTPKRPARAPSALQRSPEPPPPKE